MRSVRWVPSAWSDAVASARLRCYRPAAALARAGWDSRLAGRCVAPRADVVVFQKAYGERQLAVAERLHQRGKAVVFDLCDNHFHNPSGDPSLAERAARLARMLALADVVTVPTATLAGMIDHPIVRIVDDAIDVPAPVDLVGPGDRVVWFGNAGSAVEEFGMGDLATILPDLEAVARRTPFEFHIVSNSRDDFDRLVRTSSLRATYWEWETGKSVGVLATADVAVIPVTLNPFTACKSPNRLVTSLQLGLATVVSPVPSYSEFEPYIRVAGWRENVFEYLTRPEVRRRDVEAGRRFIAGRFPAGHLERQWDAALVEARAVAASRA